MKWQVNKAWRQTEEPLCGTKPIPATMPTGRSAFPEGQTCRTKPICLRWTGKTIPKARGLEAATRLGGQLRKTKPIFPRAGRVAVQAIVQNKANFADSQAKINCRSGKSLRDQLLVLCLRKTKPISPGTDGAIAGATCAKRSQFSPGGHGGPSPRPKALTLPPVTGAIVRNKANSLRTGGISHHSTIPSFQCSKPEAVSGV